MTQLEIYNKQMTTLYSKLKPVKLVESSASVKYEKPDGYVIKYTFIIDHNKYWRSSPNFDIDYYTEVESIGNLEFDDLLYTLPNYIMPYETHWYGTNVIHKNTKSYRPLIQLLKEESLNPTIAFDNRIHPTITFELFNSDKYKSIPDVVELVESHGFNIDDSQFYDIW
jgi:hypothetical protein